MIVFVVFLCFEDDFLVVEVFWVGFVCMMFDVDCVGVWNFWVVEVNVFEVLLLYFFEVLV